MDAHHNPALICAHIADALGRLDARLVQVVDEEAQRAELLAGDGASGWRGVRNLALPPVTDLLYPMTSPLEPLVPGSIETPIGRLTQALRLGQIERDVLLVLLAPYVEPRYQSVYALLQDDVRQPLPTERLVRAVLGREPSRAEAVARSLASGGPLRRAGIVQTLSGDFPPLAQPFTLAAEIAASLLQDFWPPLAGVLDTTWIDGRAKSQLPRCVVFAGPGGVAEEAEAQIPEGHRALLLRPDPDNNPRAALDQAWRLGLCHDAWPIFDLRPLEAAATSMLTRRAVNLTRALGGRLLLLATAPVATTVPQIECRVPAWSARVKLWKQAARDAGSDLKLTDAHRLASRYRLGRRDIDFLFSQLLEGDAREISDLAQANSAPHHAHLRAPRATLDDLVLRAPTFTALERLIHFVDNRDRIAETIRPGAAPHFPMRTGPIALFYGRPGTGKTMAAEAVAHTLDRLLHVVDASQLVSKYVGETEKHIDETMSEAERSGAILLFDEADNLFGARIEKATSAGEQFSNMVAGYLLQRMEMHDGPIILSTNMAQSIDDAFMRRFLFRIEFPLPDAGERARIWERMLEGRSEDIDLRALGDAHQLSGGEIRNAAMKAIFLADRRGARLDRDLAEEAVRQELFELGRLSRSTPADTAPDHGILLRAIGNTLRTHMETHLRELFLKEIHVLEGAPTERNLGGRRPALSIALFRLAGRRGDAESRGLRAGAILSAWSARAEEENEILGAAHDRLSYLSRLEVAGRQVTLKMQESHDFDLLQRFWTSHDQPIKPSIVLDLELL